MKVIKGFKLANTVLATALALALAGCGDDPLTTTNTDSGSSTDSGTSTYSGSSTNSGSNSEDFVADEFILISSSGEESDIDFTVDYPVGTWSTGSEIAETIYEGLSAWEITSGPNNAEQGNWGTVLVFQDGIDGDLSLFNSIDLKLATSGGYDQYKLSISGSGVGKEIVLPVNDGITTWQELSINLADFGVNLSEIDYIAVMGVGGTSSVSKFYVTDYSLVKDTEITVDTNTESDFVFKYSDSSVTSSLIVDGDDYSDVGNVIFGEWSTGTGLSESFYNGMDAWKLSAGGSWGSVLALQGDISDGTNIDNYDTDFSQYTNIKLKVASEGNFSSYILYISSVIGDYTAEQKVEFSLNDQAAWNSIDIDLDRYGIDLSNVNQIVAYGMYADGLPASQKLYITDFIAYDTGISSVVEKDSSDDKFVFISSTGEDVDIVVDGDNAVHEGNITVGEWSTSTTISTDVEYNGLNAWKLTQTSGWGAVLAMMGDTYGGVQSYDLDLNEYSTVNFKIAADADFTEYYVDFLTTTGAEAKIPLSVISNSNWKDVSISLADLPINLNQLNQIVIYGVGNSGNSLYITDFSISK